MVTGQSLLENTLNFDSPSRHLNCQFSGPGVVRYVFRHLKLSKIGKKWPIYDQISNFLMTFWNKICQGPFYWDNSENFECIASNHIKIGWKITEIM